MYTQQDKTSYNMQEYSWLQTVSVSAKRYGNTSDTGNPLWYQSYCLQMLWWTSWKTTAKNTFAHLESINEIISKSLSNEVYLSCHDFAKAPCNNAENSCISLVFIKKQELKIHTYRLHGRDFVHFGKIKRGANERAVFL